MWVEMEMTWRLGGDGAIFESRLRCVWVKMAACGRICYVVWAEMTPNLGGDVARCWPIFRRVMAETVSCGPNLWMEMVLCINGDCLACWIAWVMGIDGDAYELRWCFVWAVMERQGGEDGVAFWLR